MIKLSTIHTFKTDIRDYHYVIRIYTNFPFPKGRTSNVVFCRPLSLDPCHFLYIHINDLPKAINNRPIQILFIDDTSILFSHYNPDEFTENILSLFETLNNWFKRNLLSLNLEKNTFVL